MSNDTEGLSPRERRFQEVAAAYLAADEQGQAPSRAGLLALHPDLVEELHAFFADHDRAMQTARSMRALAGLPAAPALPCLFGDYELLSEVARGGMGVVYKARQISLNRFVALKLIRQPALASEGEIRRFLAEAEAAASLDHPNLMPIYEAGECDGQHFFAMKLMPGGSLAARVSSLVRNPRAAVTILTAVARAVHFAHQHRILHRDLKPANILLDEDDRPFVTDFGLAKVLEADRGLTRSGQVMGTPGYMAPEQAAGDNRALTTAADVYSLGAVLYELLAGRAPFEGDSALETLRRVREEEPRRPRSLNPAVDRDLETICLKCLEKKPARRYGSAEALAEDLERWLRGEPVVARPVGNLERVLKWVKRRPTVAVALAGSLLLLLGGTIFFVAVWISSQEVALQAANKQLAIFQARLDQQSRAPVRLRRQLARVAVLWEQHPADARRLLEDAEECPTELHDDAWRGYDRLCRFDRGKLKASGRVVQLAGTADGRVLLVLGADGTAKLWDVAAGKELRTVLKLQDTAPLERTRPLALSADGRMVVAVDDPGGLKIHDLASSRSAWQSSPGRNSFPTLTADGKTAAFVQGDTRVILLDLSQVNFGPLANTGMLAPGVPIPIPRFLGTPSSTPTRKLNEESQEPIKTLAFAPDARTLAAVTSSGTILLWDVANNRRSAELQGSPGIGFGLAFTPDGKTLALRCDQPPDQHGRPQPPQVVLVDVPQ
jgi:tRNA A-37 threonylcarbamoyl transferase component Bud32